MTALLVQLQPDRWPEMDVAAVVARLSSLDASARVTDAVDDGRYVNIQFAPSDAAVLWKEIRRCLIDDTKLARVATVFCQGRHGWDDYLLLHHFDRTLILDELAIGPDELGS